MQTLQTSRSAVRDRHVRNIYEICSIINLIVLQAWSCAQWRSVVQPPRASVLAYRKSARLIAAPSLPAAARSSANGGQRRPPRGRRSHTQHARARPGSPAQGLLRLSSSWCVPDLAHLAPSWASSRPFWLTSSPASAAAEGVAGGRRRGRERGSHSDGARDAKATARAGASLSPPLRGHTLELRVAALLSPALSSSAQQELSRPPPFRRLRSESASTRC